MAPDFKKKIFLVLKFCISMLTFVYLFFKIRNFTSTHNFKSIFSGFSKSESLLLFIILLLFVSNWFFESLKWRKLLHPFEKVNILNSFKAVFGGISVSLLTPNRIGEIPGRALFVSDGNKRKSMIAAGIGSISQSGVTMILGFTALIILHIGYNFSPVSPRISGYMLVLILIIFLSAGVLFFLSKTGTIKFPEKLKEMFLFTSQYKRIDIIKIQTFSLIRYFIFLVQFLLFLKIFHVHISMMEGFLSISLTYFIIFITPFLTIAEIGMRGSASLICIGHFSDNVAGILLAGVSLWMINIMVPAFIGAVIMINKKNQKRNLA